MEADGGAGRAAQASEADALAQADFRSKARAYTSTLVESYGHLLSSARIGGENDENGDAYQPALATAVAASNLQAAAEGLLGLLQELKLSITLA